MTKACDKTGLSGVELGEGRDPEEDSGVHLVVLRGERRGEECERGQKTRREREGD